MYIVLYIFLAVIILAGLLLSAALLVPLRYELQARADGLHLEFSFTLRCFFYGLYAGFQDSRFDWYGIISGRKINLNKASSPETPTEKSSQPRAKKSSPADHFRNITPERIWHLLQKLWPILSPHYLMFNARIGFDEPHYTGWLMALAGFLQRQNSSYSIHLEGVWDEPCLEGHIMVAGKFCPAALVWQMLKFMQPEIRLYIKSCRQDKCSYPRTAKA